MSILSFLLLVWLAGVALIVLYMIMSTVLVGLMMWPEIVRARKEKSND